MELDAAILSRMQFAFTVSFHILFPSITIGLATAIAIWEGLWLKTRNPVYFQLAKFWIKPFAVTFGMGVVSGIVLSFEFGTNFSGFSEKVGPVLGPLLAYEVLTAFFLEAGFLGVMLFGWQRVSERMHFFATVIVMLGTWLSAFWILSANSWMQTPAGYELVDEHFQVRDWWEVIFNPSMPHRVAHMLLAAMLTASFIIIAVSAWHVLRDQQAQWAKKSLSMALWGTLVLVPLQIFVGDGHGLNVKEYQPVKLAAIEGIWPEHEQPLPLVLFAWPNMEEERNDYEVAIPHLGSLILTHTLDGGAQGLTSVPPEDRPYVPIVFFSFRVMVGIGFLMLFVSLWALWLRRKSRLYENKPFLTVARWMWPVGSIATLAGWYVTETGRQPWLVEGLVRTMEVASPLPAEKVLWSLSVFVVLYGTLLVAYLYFMRKLLRQGAPSLEALESQLNAPELPGYAKALVKQVADKPTEGGAR
jgi:cytochrome bd quinol oxidase subunit 1 apoprotein (EC 1.10.3.-)